MIKKTVLTLLLPISMVTLAHDDDADTACNHVTPVSAKIIKKERSVEIVPGIVKASDTPCDKLIHENFQPELTESQDALLNARLPGTLLATR